MIYDAPQNPFLPIALSGGGRKKTTQKNFFFAGASRVSAYLHGNFFQNREDMSKKGSIVFALRAKKPVHFT